MEDDDTVPVGFRHSRAEHELWKRVAKAEGRSLAMQIRHAMSEYCEYVAQLEARKNTPAELEQL